MKRIFIDFDIRKGYQAPGIFLKARKPEDYVPVDLSDIALYSMILGRRTREIPEITEIPFIRRFILKLLDFNILDIIRRLIRVI